MCHSERMSVPVISTAQMRDWEHATWETGQKEAEVIRRVGGQLARAILRLTRPQDSILILAGKGHNGDDARAAAEFLPERNIRTMEVFEPESDLQKLETALGERPALVVDGLFGIGLNRPLAGSWQKIIGAVNAARLPVLAVDIPSGLNADTGETFGACIEAAHTLTVGAPKTGMLAAAAWPLVGRLEVAAEVGLIPCPLTAELNWTLPGDFQHFPPRRMVAGHKGTYGHVAVAAGSMGYHGAAVLAARGAQRAQPGLVTLFTQEDVYHPVAAQLQAVMVSLWQVDPKKMSAGFDALVVGPGLAGMPSLADLRQSLRHWWRYYENPLIVDASALDLLTTEATPAKYLRVLTPHPGEAARLLNWPVPKVQSQRVAALREISKRHGGCWVILKGHQTLVGRAEGEIFTNPSGNPHLGQGGSGDLLSGYLAGLLAQPALQTEANKTLRYAVWQHGAAADALQAGRSNWTVEDLADELGNLRSGPA